MGTKHETTACSTDDLTQIAKKLEYFAKRYRDLVTQMIDCGVQSADVTGIKTMSRAIGYIQGSLASATAAVDDAIMRDGSIGAQTPEQIKELLKEANDEESKKMSQINTSRSRRQKKGKS